MVALLTPWEVRTQGSMSLPVGIKSVNLSSLTFFRKVRTFNQQFAVIGLGRFGRAVCATLHNLGYEVLAVDEDERRVAQTLSDQIAAHAVQLDTTQLGP
jgi:trk system potassium uptake protein TrkA